MQTPRADYLHVLEVTLHTSIIDGLSETNKSPKATT